MNKQFEMQSDARGQSIVFANREDYLDVISTLKNEGFEMCIDVTATDYLNAQSRVPYPAGFEHERFELVANLLSLSKKARVRIRVPLPEDDPVVPSLFDLYPGSELMEREVYDLMGILFAGHPDLTRVLMPDDWEGHPLRKDYAQGKVPVQFKYTQNEYDTSRTEGGD